MMDLLIWVISETGTERQRLVSIGNESDLLYSPLPLTCSSTSSSSTFMTILPLKREKNAKTKSLSHSLSSAKLQNSGREIKDDGVFNFILPK